MHKIVQNLEGTSLKEKPLVEREKAGTSTRKVQGVSHKKAQKERTPFGIPSWKSP